MQRLNISSSMTPIFTYKGNSYGYEVIHGKVHTWQLSISDAALEAEAIKSGDFDGLCAEDITMIVQTVQEMDDIPYRQL